MLAEFGLSDLDDLAAFIFRCSRQGTRELLTALGHGTYRNEMIVDGYNESVTLAVTLEVSSDGIHADFGGSSPASRFGVNVPLVYTNAYAGYGLKCALAPEIPNNAASLEFFTGSAPAGCILNAVHTKRSTQFPRLRSPMCSTRP